MTVPCQEKATMHSTTTKINVTNKEGAFLGVGTKQQHL